MSKRSRIATIVIILALAIYAVVSLYVIWGLTVPLSRQQEEDRQRIAELHQQIAELEHRLENTDDPDVIRWIAEQLLGLVKPDEMIITGGINHGGD
ncbi:MAG: septum formation initiator family protein [Oscillospiraceae bacterium]|jgi:cell division protein FtsB|nr:septum formation initiator family protein [Oscillospiraceae bacterium]